MKEKQSLIWAYNWRIYPWEENGWVGIDFPEEKTSKGDPQVECSQPGEVAENIPDRSYQAHKSSIWKDLNEGSSEASERDVALGEVTDKGQLAQMLADQG